MHTLKHSVMQTHTRTRARARTHTHILTQSSLCFQSLALKLSKSLRVTTVGNNEWNALALRNHVAHDEDEWQNGVPVDHCEVCAARTHSVHQKDLSRLITRWHYRSEGRLHKMVIERLGSPVLRTVIKTLGHLPHPPEHFHLQTTTGYLTLFLISCSA